MLFYFVCSCVLLSCSKNSGKPVIIWTNKSEIVSYVELFNIRQNKCKAIVVYKENPALSLPAEKGENPPDIVIGTWLKNESTRKNFSSINYLFHNSNMKKSQFYPEILNVGCINRRQYLLPISFNLPAVIFLKKNEKLIPNNFVISPDEMRDISVKYNEKDEHGIFTYMGFAPRWNPKFLYTAAKMYGADFRESSKVFSWNSSQLTNSINYMKEWTLLNNVSSTIEEDYAFKYLYMPDYKLIAQNRCLFAFTTSDKFFSLPDEKIAGIDYRWLQFNNKCPIEDTVVFLGLCKKSKNVESAEQFILWLMKEDSQKEIIARNKDMKLNTATFGIADGFSSIKSVNEKIFTQYNPNLMKNLPISEYISSVNILPVRWAEIKENVLLPYLLDAVDTSKEISETELIERIQKWNKQYF
ncbi:MAG: hypothetical protein ACTTHG_03210 [Treponemataceae bacterium]